MNNPLYKFAIIFLVFLISFVCFSYNFADPDLWGHIKFGEETYKTKTIQRYDNYSYVFSGRDWVNHEWLSEVIFYVLYRFLGSAGLVLFKITLGLIITFMLLKIILLRIKSSWQFLSILLIISVSVISFGFSIRPQIFTYLFFTLFLYLLCLFKYKDKNFIFLTPLIMIFWVNVHGGFVSGIGLLLIFIIGGLISKDINNKKLLILSFIFLATCASTIINPYFIKLWYFLASSLIQSRPYIWEWRSFNFDFLSISSGIYYVLLILLSIFFIVSSKVKISFTEVLLLLVSFVLSLRHIRHVPFFGIAAISIIPHYAEEVILRKKENLVIFIKKISIVFLCMLSVFLIYYEFSKRGANFLKIRLEEDYYPIKTVEFIKQNKLEGNLLTEFDWSQYCIWKLYPDNMIYIDGRYMTVYPNEAIEEFFDFLYMKQGWKDFLNKYPHHWILIAKIRPLSRFLHMQQDWVTVCSFKDSPSILFVRKDSIPHKRFLKKIESGSFIYPEVNASYIFP